MLNSLLSCFMHSCQVSFLLAVFLLISFAALAASWHSIDNKYPAAAVLLLLLLLLLLFNRHYEKNIVEGTTL